MLDLIEAKVLPIGQKVMLNPCDSKIFLNARYFLSEDKKIASIFIFFSEIDFVFNAELVSTRGSADGVDRVPRKERADGFNLKSDVFPVAEGLGEMK